MTADSVLADRLDALLPQTQCGQCGYGGCMPYAEAMARGDTAHNRCPPGGSATIAALASALGQLPLPLDPACGEHKPRTLAYIREAECIGCTKCIQACPVDAIVGASKRMHMVLEALCTGCELCVAPCPVDCIELLPNVLPRMSVAESNAARLRHRARQQRLGEELVQQTHHAATSSVDGDVQALTAALARASARRGSGGKP
ncbi:Electron transport complex, RnfB [mine drainage metagenome]|uniref:Electron transport complex, RnfB n=1 Tax=mine drainage metagenome TaxID=410659 RepID=T0ZTV6_9ZZZZ